MRIMLVEDVADDEFLTIRGLQRLEVTTEVIVARDGVEALEMLFGGDAPLPDLVLLDLTLPKLSGLAVLRRIRSEKSAKRLPVVILTSSDDDRNKTASYEAGATQYLHKGLDIDQLVADLQRIIHGLCRSVPAA